MSQGVSVIDLFCGVGGLTRGVIDAGLQVRAGVDVDFSCRYAYETNNRPAVFIERDIQDRFLPDILEGIYGLTDLRVMIGCAPCQPFSSHTQKYKQYNRPGLRNLLYHFASLVERVQVDVIAMENVARVMTQPQYSDFISYIKMLGFNVWATSIECSQYGIPQRRFRLVLLASRLGPIHLCAPQGIMRRTVRDAIGHLEPILAGDKSSKDPLHISRGLSPLNLERIRASLPGGTWKDWDYNLRLNCHRRTSGQTYTSVYTRMKWDDPSPTITTQFHSFGTGRFGHPEQDRALSLREGALLQTFPEDYQFVSPNLFSEGVSMTKVGTQIGNAVPVQLAQVIGKSISHHLNKHGFKMDF